MKTGTVGSHPTRLESVVILEVGRSGANSLSRAKSSGLITSRVGVQAHK